MWIMDWKWERITVYCSVIYIVKNRQQEIPRGFVIIIIMNDHISVFTDMEKTSTIFEKKHVCMCVFGYVCVCVSLCTCTHAGRLFTN